MTDPAPRISEDELARLVTAAQEFVDHVFLETKTHTGCPARLHIDAAIAAARSAPAAGLDAAWAEAEAALGARADWWRIRSLVETAFAPMRWEVVATDGNRIARADGPTPATALRALAVALREPKP